MAKPKKEKNTASATNMERAKKRAKAGTPKRERRSLKEYFKGVRLEMKKVVWPTKKELGSYTVVVLLACAVFALAFWAIDSGFLALLKAVLGISIS